MNMRTCVAPSGRFIFGIHQPRYRIANLRQRAAIEPLGATGAGDPVDNRQNFPSGDLQEEQGRWIFEIPNALPFRGTTYIDKSWADARAKEPASIRLPPAPSFSFRESLARLDESKGINDRDLSRALAVMPEPVLLALAANSTDPADLIAIANLSCEFIAGENGGPLGLKYRSDESGRNRPIIQRHALFEAVANNPHLPDDYKVAMVLRPGVQGSSEVVGEWRLEEKTHIFEYLRRNSYIPWGHYAANFADDAVRYRLGDLAPPDMRGLRHLYYQRTYIRLAEDLGLRTPRSRSLSVTELEELRRSIISEIHRRPDAIPFTATLWGWNYGFDFTPSGYRLHASHQQIHQQFALLPSAVDAWYDDGEPAGTIASYGCGDLVAEFIGKYRRQTGEHFFEKYLTAIRGNRRMDRGSGDSNLILHEDEDVMLFVPKAQTSQWELQILTLKPVGNILEADTACRASLDRALLVAMRILAAMGARMVTTIEFPKRFVGTEEDQRLLYSFLPRLPESPGAFSEAQLRFINGHYPEDFAAACRARMRDAGLVIHPEQWLEQRQ
jgi:hypothetical protein